MAAEISEARDKSKAQKWLPIQSDHDVLNDDNRDCLNDDNNIQKKNKSFVQSCRMPASPLLTFLSFWSQKTDVKFLTINAQL